MCHVFNLVIPKTQHISKTTTALTLVWMFFPFQTQRQVNKPYARRRAASWNTKLQMKLHASFPILAEAATQPAALLYHRGRTATGFIAARCHRAPFPSSFGRPAARSSAEEREERRGTIAPGSCALLAAPRRKPAPAVSPSARLPALAARPRGTQGARWGTPCSRPPQGAPPQHPYHPITPGPPIHLPLPPRRRSSPAPHRRPRE